MIRTARGSYMRSADYNTQERVRGVVDGIWEALNAALPAAFPEAIDETQTPEMQGALDDALEEFVGAWLDRNSHVLSSVEGRMAELKRIQANQD